jgi:tripartite-type tricarboxylate transporter receptor subunit TctC
MPARRVSLLCGFAFLAALAQAAAAGDGFPGKTARLMVAFPPGGGQDLVARVLAPKLSASTGQTVIVENSSGGAGFVGIMAVTQGRPDGAYLLINTMGMSVNAAIYRKLPFDSAKDIEPTALVGTTPFYLAVNPQLGFNTAQAFLLAARANPGKYKGASFANSTGALTIELLRQRAGINVQTVPYRGVAPAAAAVISGEADFLMVDGASILPFIDSGRLKGLAVAAASRVAERPDLPTLIEAGVPDFVINSWFGMFVRGGTPSAITDRWNQEINKALALPDVQQRLISIGMTPAPQSREAFVKLYRDDIAHWKDVVEKGNVPLLD